MEKYNLRM